MIEPATKRFHTRNTSKCSIVGKKEGDIQIHYIREYFELLVEEYYFAKLYDKSVELLDKVRQMFGGNTVEQKFLHALIQRYAAGRKLITRNDKILCEGTMKLPTISP